ncbi:MAG TPA: exo-beta-N-acetylmuramidase NamZ domain-containing protein, partial [Verrucomicrobiae bacterium]|nr:exo-beta-N-acetylmuramidase NamZ domain-containing protein [Verrucomicrobiae bacterium]
MTGLDVLVAEGFERIRGQRVGLVAHPASVDSRLDHAAELLAHAPGVKLEVVFGPEHGWLGELQDLAPATADFAGAHSPRVVSLYGEKV